MIVSMFEGKPPMLNALRRVLILAISCNLCACMLSAGPVSRVSPHPLEPSPKAVTLLADGPYVADMASALSALGFRIAPVPVPGVSTSTRYGIRFHMEVGQMMCALTSSVVGYGVLTVVDMKSGETVTTISQNGATGPCTTIDPVYPGIAAELVRLWIPPKG